MLKNIDFYFDFGSPYSYMAFHRLLQICKNTDAQITWKPMLLGGVFKATGNHSPMVIPAKANYCMIDLQRWSKLWSIPMQMNPYFPINTLQLMRSITAIHLYQPDSFPQAIQTIFQAMFGQPRNLNDEAEFEKLVKELGLDKAQVMTWLSDEQVKTQLKDVTEEAVARGIFGAPTCFYQEEIYWGVDSLHFLEVALA